MKLKFTKSHFYVRLHKKSVLYEIIGTLALNQNQELLAEICSNIYFTVKDNENILKNQGFVITELNINSRFLTIKYTELYNTDFWAKTYPYMICSDKAENLFKVCSLFKTRDFYVEKSDLFYFSGKYYLFILPKIAYYPAVENILSGQTEYIKVSDIFYSKVNEHGIAVIKENAVKKINDYFNEE